LEAENEVRGEATIVIGGATEREAAVASAEADARLLLAHDTPARAVQELLMARHGMAKRDAYALVLRLRDR